MGHTYLCIHTAAHTWKDDGGGVVEKENRKCENRNEGGGGLINPPFGGILKTFDSSAHPLPTCLLFCEVV